MNRILRVGAITLALLVPLTSSIASANGSESTVQRQIAELVEQYPHAVVDGNNVDLGNGDGFLVFDVGTFSLNECPSERFCLWPNTNYDGAIYYRSSVGTHYPPYIYKSLWNNRSNASRLYNHDSTASFCYLPDAKVASITSSYQAPEKLRLYSTTTC
jgi:hypothetical protein